jgi:hypothetical protein
MLFGPENGEQFRDPPVDRSQPMQARVACGADGDQELRVADAGMPVVNVEVPVPCPAAGAAEVMAGEHDFRTRKLNPSRTAYGSSTPDRRYPKRS